ncbi:MAG: hypothetical protein ACAH88_03715 [Roseimicrobium sp.]
MKTSPLSLFGKLIRLLTIALSVLVTTTWQPKAVAEEGACQLCGGWKDPSYINSLRALIANAEGEMLFFLSAWQINNGAAQTARENGNTELAETFESNCSSIEAEMLQLAQVIQSMWDAEDEWIRTHATCSCPPEDECPNCYQLASACTCPPCPTCYQLVALCSCPPPESCATCYQLVCICPPPEQPCSTCYQLVCVCPPPEGTCVNCSQLVSMCICGPLP